MPPCRNDHTLNPGSAFMVCGCGFEARCPHTTVVHNVCLSCARSVPKVEELILTSIEKRTIEQLKRELQEHVKEIAAIQSRLDELNNLKIQVEHLIKKIES